MKRLLLVSAVSIALLSGCAHNPQTAAIVDGHAISTHDLDVLTKALCVEQSGSDQSQPTSLSSLRESALSALISTQVDADYAAKHDLTYPKTELASRMEQIEGLITKLPAADQDRARTLINDLLRGQLQLQTAAVSLLQQSGQQATNDTVTSTIQRIESDHAKTLKTVVNPRYDTGTTKTADGASVSRAVSSAAQAALNVLRGKKSDTTTTYAASLPGSQRCG